jgi:hypothetical protein
MDTYRNRINVNEARHLIAELAAELGMDEAAIEERLRRQRIAERRQRIAELTRAGGAAAATQVGQHQRALDRLEVAQRRYETGRASAVNPGTDPAARNRPRGRVVPVPDATGTTEIPIVVPNWERVLAAAFRGRNEVLFIGESAERRAQRRREARAGIRALIGLVREDRAAAIGARPAPTGPATPAGEHLSDRDLQQLRNDGLDHVVDEVLRLRDACDWHRRRFAALQREQRRMREPEATVVCDILANGNLLPDPHGHRYGELAAGRARLLLATLHRIEHLAVQCGVDATTLLDLWRAEILGDLSE